MAKYKYSRKVSPRGVFRFAWLDKPDMKFAKKEEDGQYKTTIMIPDNDESREWCDNLRALAAKEAKEAGEVKLKRKFKMPFIFPEDIDEEDFEEDEETGKAKFGPECRDKIMFETKTRYKPGLIDAAKQALEDGVKIMGGDEGRVKVEINPYDGFGGGVSLRLITAQLLEKNTSFSGGGVDDDGFDEEEGYTGGGEGDDAEEEEDF